jgi:predicted acyltransferase
MTSLTTGFPTREATPSTAGPPGRLVSLDVFRGLTVAAMIVVNNPGSDAAYAPLQHADWNGWTPTDLVFPFFLFIVGVSVVFSLSSRVAAGEPRRALLFHVLRRGGILFGLGLLLNGFFGGFQLSTWRVEGVLQRIALSYVACAVLVLWSNRRGWVIAVVGCLVGYWALLRFVPVPGFGVPGRDVPLLDRVGNLTAFVDRALLAGHLDDETSDPEGLLSTVGAVATTLLGVLAGERLRSKVDPKDKLVWLLGVGAACAVAGQIADTFLPINKKLWTSSYVLFTGGLALLGLALVYWLLDVKKLHSRAIQFPLVLGANAIAAYLFAEVLQAGIDFGGGSTGDGPTGTARIHELLFAPLASPPLASLLYSLAFLLVCWGAMWLLYRKRIFIKI